MAVMLTTMRNLFLSGFQQRLYITASCASLQVPLRNVKVTTPLQICQFPDQTTRYSTSSAKDHSNQRNPANISIKNIIEDEIGIPSNKELSSENEVGDAWSTVTSIKYEQFDDANSRVIHDITEEELGLIEPKQPTEIQQDPLADINTNRGVTGVYDVQDLVDVLNLEQAKDIIVMAIPAEVHFVDHMVIVSANSQRHLNAVASLVRVIYNKKMNKKTDRALILEGRDSPWVAMDMGNIALHIMSPAERRRVDMESLWVCGAAHDTKICEDAAQEVDDIFTLADPIGPEFIDEKPYDITKEYDHPFHPVGEHDVLPDFEEINDSNRQQYCATSILEMALKKHNKHLSKKFRGRFKK